MALFIPLALIPAPITARAAAAEITVLCPRGVQHAVGELADAFRRETAHQVRFAFGTAGGLHARAVGGEPADIVIVSSAGIDDLVRRGAVIAGTRADVGRVGVGVAARAGAPRPDVSTPEALTQALLAARSLAYADPAKGGQGGIHFARVVERLGIADAVRAKTVLFPEGLMALESIARGEHELGAAPISEIVAVKGLVLAGPLPTSLQNTLTYSAAVLIVSKAPDTARAFIAFLTGDQAKAVFRAAGFEPSP